MIKPALDPEISMQVKSHRLVADAMRNSKMKLDQQQQDATAATAATAAAAGEKQRRHSHHHHQKLHSQHPLVGIVRREPLRQHPNGQPLQRHLISKKRSEFSAANQSARRGSSTLESVRDATESELDPTEESSVLQQQRHKPCLDRAARLPAEMPDVDRNGHCTMVSAYAKDIFVYLAERELHYALPPDLLAGHAEVTERSRAVLVDWLLQLSSRLELQADTYHLAVRLLDHYLAVDRSVAKRHLQLLGATALWLASKFEEVYCISVGDLLHVCSGACNRRDLLAMEVRLVGALDFHLLPPLPITFLRRLSKVADVDNRLHYVAKYLLELATLCARLACLPASLLAAGAMRVALGSAGRDWSDLMAFYSGYGLPDLRQVAAGLAGACIAAATAASSSASAAVGVVGTVGAARHHRFVYQKYRSAKCFAVAACSQLRPDSKYLADLIAQDAQPSGLDGQIN